MGLETVKKHVAEDVIARICRENKIHADNLLTDTGASASSARAQLWQSMREAGFSFAEIARISGRKNPSSVYSALQRAYPKAYPRTSTRGRRPASA